MFAQKAFQIYQLFHLFLFRNMVNRTQPDIVVACHCYMLNSVASFLIMPHLVWPQLPNEPVMRRITTDKATKRTRQILSDAEWVSLRHKANLPSIWTSVHCFWDAFWQRNTLKSLCFICCLVMKTYYESWLWHVFWMLMTPLYSRFQSPWAPCNWKKEK